DGLNLLSGFVMRLTLLCTARPNMKAAVIADGDFPRAPDAFAFAEPAIKDIMRADIALDPVALASSCFVAAFDEESPDIIIALAGHETAGKGRIQIHTAPGTR